MVTFFWFTGSPHTLLSKNTPDISMSTVYLDQTMVSIDNIQNIQKILTIVSSSIFEPDFVPPPSNSVQFLRNCSSPKLYTRDYWTAEKIQETEQSWDDMNYCRWCWSVKSFKWTLVDIVESQLRSFRLILQPKTKITNKNKLDLELCWPQLFYLSNLFILYYMYYLYFLYYLYHDIMCPVTIVDKATFTF